MRRRTKITLWLSPILLLLLLSVVVRLPENTATPSYSLEGSTTVLGTAMADKLAPYEGQGLSGVHILNNGRDAFVARVVSMRLAERSIDMQYYLFHQDTVGKLVIEEALAAADRGVRIRLLVDDIDGGEADGVWAALDSHPDIEVRLYNPFVREYPKNLQFITEIRRVNHRMHSKTFTVDGTITVVGGRNIGNEYFDADPGLAFTDLDVLAIGSVVPQVTSEFDEYWNSRRTYPVSLLMPTASPDALDALRRDLSAAHARDEARVYLDAANESDLADALRARRVQFTFAPAEAIHDDPEKLTQEDGWKDELLITQLAPHIRNSTEEFILISPYFVPGQRGTEALCALSERGTKVRILTNSLASNDVAAAHAGYARHRNRLLRCGVTLYEFNEELKRKQSEEFTWLPVLSKSSLHAKAMAMDRTEMFVGSFNFDLRSAHLNNEIGILFKDEVLVNDALERFDQRVAKDAFRVEMTTDAHGQETLRWVGEEDGQTVVYTTEPHTTFWKRLTANLLLLLPVDPML